MRHKTLTRYRPRKHTEHPIGKRDGDRLRAEHLLRRQDRVEGHVGKHVHDRHQRAGNCDGTGQILHRVLQLLDDEVQIVPVGKWICRVRGLLYIMAGMSLVWLKRGVLCNARGIHLSCCVLPTGEHH